MHFAFRSLSKVSNLVLTQPVRRQISKINLKSQTVVISRHSSSHASSNESVEHGSNGWHVDRPETAQASRMTDIGTRKIFSEEHDLFRANVRKFFQEECVPYHNEWEKQGHVSRELWLKAGANGLLGVNCPEELGGVGGDWLSAVIVQDEQAYALCSGPGFTLHSDIVIPYITSYGTKQQIDHYIPKLVSGSYIGAIAMSEPGAGSDLQGVRTYARREGDDWILNGSKTFITNGYLSDVVIVVAVTDTEAKSAAHGISLFLVDAGTKGFKKGRKLEKIGLKAQDTSELFFDDVRLPKTALLGEINKGFFYLMQDLPQERLIIASMGLAACEALFEQTLDYVRERKAFGRTIASLQTTQHKLAEMKTEICVGRSFVDMCNKIHNDTGLDTQMASMAKYWVSEMQNKIATQCLQMHGGMGYMWEMPVARAFCDFRVQPIYGGSNEIMKELIARLIVTAQ